MTKKPTIYEKIENKELWPDGPWKNEPDEKKFKYRGIKCLIRRAIGMGHLCGYAIFPSNIISDEIVGEINVHGCITFDEISDNKKEIIIGFDCSHYFDTTPVSLLWDEKIHNSGFTEKFLPKDPELRKEMFEAKKRYEARKTYKDIEFVEKEIKSMVDQVLENKK